MVLLSVRPLKKVFLRMMSSHFLRKKVEEVLRFQNMLHQKLQAIGKDIKSRFNLAGELQKRSDFG